MTPKKEESKALDKMTSISHKWELVHSNLDFHYFSQMKSIVTIALVIHPTRTHNNFSVEWQEYKFNAVPRLRKKKSVLAGAGLAKILVETQKLPGNKTIIRFPMLPH